MEGKKYEPKQIVVDLPAIYVAFLMDKASTELFSKKAWLAVDGVMLLVGAGEVKVFFTTASWVRRIIVASSIVGSSVGILVESLPSGVISDQLRNRLRILTAVLQVPEAVKGIGDLGKSVIKELRASKSSTTVAKEQQAIEDVASGLEKDLGAAEAAGDAAKASKFTNYKKLLSKLDDLEASSPGIKQRFFDDFADLPAADLAKFEESPELVDTWKKFGDAPLRKNPKVLEKARSIECK